MKKNFFVFLVLLILSTPLVILSVISVLQVKPETNNFSQSFETMPQESEELPKQDKAALPNTPSNPSASFMNGYWDGWHGKWLGPIRWTLSDEYRQGHMLGSYDRKKGVDDRYPKKK